MAYRNFLEGYLTTTCILALIFLGYYLIAMSYSSSHAIYCRQCWEDKRFVITRRIHRAENLLSTYSVMGSGARISVQRIFLAAVCSFTSPQGPFSSAPHPRRMAKVFHIQREHFIQGPHSSLGPEGNAMKRIRERH